MVRISPNLPHPLNVGEALTVVLEEKKRADHPFRDLRTARARQLIVIYASLIYSPNHEARGIAHPCTPFAVQKATSVSRNKGLLRIWFAPALVS